MNLERQQRNVRLYVASVTVVALALFGAVARLDLIAPQTDVNIVALVLFGALFVISEARPAMWMRFGDGGEVTPGWAFAYAMLLLGCPTGATLLAVTTTCLIGLRHRKGALKILFNSSQVAISLSSGALILRLFGVRGSITSSGDLPLRGGIGIVAGGAAVFLLSGFLTAIVIGLHEGAGLRKTMRAGFALSMMADGALLALAPVFVIAIEFSIIMLPLLGVTSFLVYQSARTALQREHEATHDPLTKLLNRRAFDERVAEVLSEAAPHTVALLVMDLDRFKDINDRLGHHVGDLLLISFAGRLEREIPTGAIASRLGGDEFAVVVPGLRSSADAKSVVARLHDRLGHVHDIDGFPLSVKVSVGVAVGPEPGMTAESMMATADIAMYRAKRHESGVEIESDDSLPSDHGRVGLLPDLTAAIQNSQLTANYQPLVSVRTGQIVGVEALVRWQHPVHGNIPPSEFIGLAEQTDLIGPLTYEMIRLSVRELLSLGALMPNLAVNVSPRSLLDRRFAHDVVDIIAESGFPADRLEIEITERAIVTASERTGVALGHLRDAGVSVSVDDFGTGYSSFRILRQVRADRLKIDREFTSRLGESEADELIVTKMIELGHGLGLEVVAEGVETPEVWHRLRALGCDVAQGYCIARPMPLAELRAWLADRTSAVSIPGRVRTEVFVS